MEFDQKLPLKLKISWQTNLPGKIEVPRSIVKHQEASTSVSIHAFGDASSQGMSRAVYAVMHQPSRVSQGLMTAKSRLGKKGLKITRLELVAGHMAANLVCNVTDVLEGYPLEGVYCWLDSSVTLHWIKGGEDQKQFVSNRVRNIQWRHVGTKENPADLGSCGRGISKCLDLWWHGPSWLPYQHRWLENTVTTPTKETQAVAKIGKIFWT